MQPDPIPLCTLLDPRPADLAARTPLADAVNIPITELRGRTHELPDPAAGPIRVAAAGEYAREAIATLAALGRHAVEASTAPEPQPALDVAPGRLWSPTAFLHEWVMASGPPVPAGRRALDLGCGTGRDAVYLAAWGWQVRAVDIDPSAIERGTRLQQRYRVTAGRIEWQIADVERLGGAGEVSAFTLPADGPFDLIICFRFLPRRFLAGVGAWLSPGGTLLLETFSPAHAARFGRPASRERVLSVEDAEAIAAVAGLRVIRCEEAAKEAVETTRLHAIRT